MDKTTLLKTILAAATVYLLGSQCGRAGQLNEGNSTSGSIHFVVKGPQDERKIFLSPADHPQDEVELCQTEGWGNLELHFSPDDSWLVIQDGGSSLGVAFRLFQRDRGVIYKELAKADIDGKAERAALEQNHLAPDLLDHHYMKLLAWSADSKSFLFSLSGHGGDKESHVEITHWLGLYHLAPGTIGFDLAEPDHAAVVRQKK